MGDSNKERDPEKGHAVHAAQPLIGEGIASTFSKPGDRNMGTTLEDSKDIDWGKMGYTKTQQKDKKNPSRKQKQKKFHKAFKPVPRDEPKDTNMVGNITKLLPANTFLMFQTLAPLATNEGECKLSEIIMTSLVLVILATTCMLVCFTDTIQFNGKVYYGLVTPSGLWNPSFKGDPSFADLRQYEHNLAEFYEERKRYKTRKAKARMEGLPRPPRPWVPVKPTGPHIIGSTFSSGNSQYELNGTDFLQAILSATAFGSLTMLTNPVKDCFYSKAPGTVVKTLPLLLGFIISAVFAFSPPARNGIAHPLSPKVPSQMDNYKPPDPHGVVHGPSLPPKPPANHGQATPKPGDDDDHDGLGGSVMKYLGKFVGSPAHEEENSRSPPEHHKLDGLKAFASGLFSKHGDDLKHGAAKMVHDLEDHVKKEANQSLLRAAPAVAELSKDIHIPRLLQEAVKSVQHEALVAGLVNAGAHPELAIAAVQSAAQGAKDAAMNQIHQELQAVTSETVAGLSKQSSLALTRANSMLQSAGSSLSLPSAHDAPAALFHQAVEVLKRHNSDLPSNMHAAGPEAAAIALATGQALMNAGFQLPSAGLSPQGAALNAFAENMGNQLNLNSAKALVNDTTSLVNQGSRNVAEIHEEFARQSAALSQGLNSQMQTVHFPSVSSAQTVVDLLTNSNSNQGTLAATLAAGVAREAGTLLHEGADSGMAGVHAEIARQKAAAVQSIVQPASSMAQGAVSMGSQGMSYAKAELLKQKEVWTHEMESQARALSIPATSVAQDLATLVTTQAGSQPTASTINSRFVESLALGMAQGMAAQAGSHPQSTLAPQFPPPAASVAIDIASLLQQGSHMHAQLARQTSALTPQVQAAAAMLQHQASFSQLQQPSVIDNHMALRHLASRLSPPPSSPELGTSPVMLTSPSSWRDSTSLIIQDVKDAAAAGHHGANRLTRGASQLPSVTEELVAQAAARSPSASQAVSLEIVSSTSDAAALAALASRTRILCFDRPESSEIVDSISVEEMTSESETELGNRAQFRAGDSISSSLQGPVKRT